MLEVKVGGVLRGGRGGDKKAYGREKLQYHLPTVVCILVTLYKMEVSSFDVR